MKSSHQLILSLIATSTLIVAPLVFAQFSDLSATVQFANGQSVTVTDFSTPIEIQTSEIVNITIQFPPGFEGEPVKVEPTDGGWVSNGSSVLVVNPDGTIRFVFRATNYVGQNGISVEAGSNSFQLQLRVSNAG
jgi:hypothetical protein